MAKLTRRRVLAAKAEATPGTAESLTATEGVFNVYDMEFNSDMQRVDRDGQSALSRLPAVPGQRPATMSFGVDLYADAVGAVPDWATVFLTACGMAETTKVFSPETGSTDTVTIGAYTDGLLKLVVGAMGTFTIDLTSGEHGRINFEFTGKYGGTTDVALITPTYPTIIPPRFGGGVLTLGSYTPRISTAQIVQNNTVTNRMDATDVTGILAAEITDRDYTMTMDPEADTVAAFDAYGNQIAGTEVAFTAVIGATNNQVTLAAPKSQIVTNTDGDRDGLLTHDNEFKLNRSAAAGDDEFTITFG